MMLNEDWETIESLLPSGWRELAETSGALKQLREDKDPASLLRTMFIHFANGCSLRETAVRARRAGLADISDVALLNRIKKSKGWLKELCRSLLSERGLSEESMPEAQFRIFDATHIKEQGKTGSQWRVHYSIAVPSLECDFFNITPSCGQGNGEKLAQFDINAGDRIVADRGYSHASGIHYAAECGAAVCVRLNAAGLRLENEHGETLNVLSLVKKLKRCGAVGSWGAHLPSPEGKLLPVRICAIRKSREQIRDAHKKLRRRASKNGQKLQPGTLELAKFVIVVTTFPEHEMTAAEILECYRIRWQIELVFKRFKQVAQLGHLPKRDEDSSEAWLYGKLLCALLTEKIISSARSFSPWGYGALSNKKPLARV